MGLFSFRNFNPYKNDTACNTNKIQVNDNNIENVGPSEVNNFLSVYTCTSKASAGDGTVEAKTKCSSVVEGSSAVRVVSRVLHNLLCTPQGLQKKTCTNL